MNDKLHSAFDALIKAHRTLSRARATHNWLLMSLKVTARCSAILVANCTNYFVESLSDVFRMLIVNSACKALTTLSSVISAFCVDL